MSGYKYDDLLSAHFEKCAGPLGRAAWFAGSRAAQAGLGYASGGLIAPGAAGQAGAIASQAAPVLDMVNKGPRTVTASLREKEASYTLKKAATSWKDIVSPLSYAAMLAGTLSHHVIDPVKHPLAAAAAHYGLEGAGLAGLLATTGHDYFGEPKEKRDWRNLADLGALAAFAGVNAHRAWSPPSDH